jgi:hypothetical protein
VPRQLDKVDFACLITQPSYINIFRGECQIKGSIPYFEMIVFLAQLVLISIYLLSLTKNNICTEIVLTGQGLSLKCVQCTTKKDPECLLNPGLPRECPDDKNWCFTITEEALTGYIELFSNM